MEKFDFIFNTIPAVILDGAKLNRIKKECLIIDLASKPGGVDFITARSMGVSVEWALGLPRKNCTENFGRGHL